MTTTILAGTTIVEYHGSLAEYHGDRFILLAHDSATDRFTLREDSPGCPAHLLAVLRFARRESFTIMVTSVLELALTIGVPHIVDPFAVHGAPFGITD